MRREERFDMERSYITRPCQFLLLVRFLQVNPSTITRTDTDNGTTDAFGWNISTPFGTQKAPMLNYSNNTVSTSTKGKHLFRNSMLFDLGLNTLLNTFKGAKVLLCTL